MGVKKPDQHRRMSQGIMIFFLEVPQHDTYGQLVSLTGDSVGFHRVSKKCGTKLENVEGIQATSKRIS